MPPDRRRFLRNAAALAASVACPFSRAQSIRVFTDSAARKVALPARADRIYLAPSVPFGWIDFPPSINRLIGLRWLACILYPDAFPEDLRPIVRDFYARCYHQTPTEAQLDQLLSQPAPST